jgi:hypothetical protein
MVHNLGRLDWNGNGDRCGLSENGVGHIRKDCRSSKLKAYLKDGVGPVGCGGGIL